MSSNDCDNKNNEGKKKIIIITGGSGLVGKGIQIALKNFGKHKENKENSNVFENQDSKWIFLSSKDGDLRNLKETEAIFKKFKPTHVIHLAARVGGLFGNLKAGVQFFRENISINDNVLYCCNKFDVIKCISCLSTCIFPDKTTYPINEEMLHLGEPHHSNEGYAYAKRMLDVLGRLYTKQYPDKTLYTTIIPTNIFGPFDNFNIENGHVIPGLIHKCYLSKKNSKPFIIWGSGKPLRQFIYSIDLGHLIIKLLYDYNSTQPIIVSTSEKDEQSIKNVSNQIVSSMKFNGEVIFDTSKSDGQFKKTADNSKLLKLFPNFKFTPFNEAIQSTCDWFNKNYENSRK